MAGHSDGSIIVDTDVNPDGFKSGSNELLSAIKSLTQVMKQLGTTMQTVFSGSDKAIGGSDAKIQQLEATVQSLEEKAQSLSATVAELEAKLADLSKNKPAQTPVDGVAEAAQGADDKVTALETKIKELESIITSLQAQLQAATATPAAADIDTGEAEAKIAMLEDRIQELENAIAALEQSGGNTTAPTVDFGGATEKASSLQRQIDAVNNSVTNLEPTFQRAMSGNANAMATFQGKASALEQKIAALRQKLDAMGSAQVPTQKYQALTAEITKTGQKFDALFARQQKMESMGVKQDSAQWKSLQYDMDLVSQKYRELIALKSQMEASGTAFQMGNQTAQYQQLSATLSAASARLNEMQASTTTSVSLMSRLAAAARSVGTGIATAARWITGKMVSGLKAAASHMASLAARSKSLKSPFGGFLTSLKRLTPALLATEGLLGLLRKSVNAYMQANTQLASQLSACWSGIGNVLGPIITRLVSLVATAVAYVTQFLRLLGFVGASTSKAIKSAGGGAKKETDKLKRQLASFDELNILSDDESESGGGGASTDTGELPEVTLPDWVEMMVDHLKSGNWAEAATILTNQLNGVVAGVDWAGIGDSIGYYLNGALTFLATAILTFDWVGLGTGLATGVNQILYSVDWANLGVVLGGKFIALLGTLAGFVATLDWGALGKAFADGFMGLWNAIDWAQAARTLSNSVIGLLTTISTAIKNMDWQKIGNDAATFIATIDWSGIVSALANGIGAALGGLASLIWGLIEDAWASVVDWWYTTAYEDGEFTMEGLLQGIWNGICGIGQWIVDNIFTPFIDGFKAAFDIHSPSTVMAEQGGFIIEGLLQGITSGWASITSFFGEALSSIGESISSAWENVKSWTSDAWSKVSSTVGGAWESVKSWTSNAAQNVKTSVSNGFTSAKNTVATAASNIYNSVSSKFSSVASTISSKITSAKNAVSTGFTNAKNAVTTAATNIYSTISSKFSSVASTVSSKITSAKSAISTGFTNAKNSVTTLASSIYSTVSSKFSTVASTISSKISSIKSTISSGFNSAKTSIETSLQSAMGTIGALDWHSVGSNICTGIGNGINAGWNWLKSKVSSLAQSLLSAAKSALGIHSPSRLFRDAVGLNIGYGVGEGIEAAEGAVLDSVIGVADAIAHEFNANEYSIGSVVSNTDIDGALTAFSDKIADSFAGLMDRLQAIANSTSFTTPRAALGTVVPYTAQAEYIAKTDKEPDDVRALVEAIAAELIPAMMAGFEAVVSEQQSTREMISEIEVGDTVIGQAANRYNRKMAIVNGGT